MSTYEFLPPSDKSINQLTTIADTYFEDVNGGTLYRESTYQVGQYYIDIRTNQEATSDEDTVRTLSYSESSIAKGNELDAEMSSLFEKDYGNLTFRLEDTTSNTSLTIAFNADKSATYDIFYASDSEDTDVTEDEARLFGGEVDHAELDQIHDSMISDQLGLNILNEQQAQICKELLESLGTIDTSRADAPVQLQTHYEALLSALKNGSIEDRDDANASKQPVQQSTFDDCEALALGATRTTFIQEVKTNLQNGNELSIYRTRPAVVKGIGHFALMPAVEYAVDVINETTDDKDQTTTARTYATLNLDTKQATCETTSRISEDQFMERQFETMEELMKLDALFDSRAISPEEFISKHEELSKQQFDADQQMFAAKTYNQNERRRRQTLRDRGRNKMSDADAKHLTGVLLSDEH